MVQLPRTKFIVISLFFHLFLINNSFGECNPELNAEIQKIIEADKITFKIPAIEVSIICPEDDIPRDFVAGTVALDQITKINKDHLFQIGSETKSFIAAIILQLESEGRLLINDPVKNYLDSLPDEWQNVSIQQLLNHSSGIYNYTDIFDSPADNGDWNKQWSSSDLIALVTDKPLYFKPGTGWHYSNTNYVLAGMIIEHLTGQTLDKEINDRLIKPLAMSNTYYLPSSYTPEILSRMAHGYAQRGNFPDEPKDITTTNHSWANAAGAIVSTSHDTAIWFKNLMQGTILMPEQLKELMILVDIEPPVNDNPAGYGLGVAHDYKTFGEEAWWHSGGTIGYTALMIWLKNHNVIITANISHATANKDIYELTQHIASYIRKNS